MSRVPDIKPNSSADLEQDKAREEMWRRPRQKRSPIDFIFSSPRRMKIFFYGFIFVIASVVLLRLSFMYKLAGLMP